MQSFSSGQPVHSINKLYTRNDKNDDETTAAWEKNSDSVLELCHQYTTPIIRLVAATLTKLQTITVRTTNALLTSNDCMTQVSHSRLVHGVSGHTGSKTFDYKATFNGPKLYSHWTTVQQAYLDYKVEKHYLYETYGCTHTDTDN